MDFPNSSVIKTADYDPDALTLDVIFTTGRTYTYFDVPGWEYDGLVTASSAGEYFNAHIRDQYAFRERTNFDCLPKENAGALAQRFEFVPIHFRNGLITRTPT